MDPPNDPLKIFCSILGMFGNPFGVEIEQSLIVDQLTIAIMNQNPHAFADVDVRQIDLWKVRGNKFLYFMPLALICLNSLMTRSLQIPLKRSSSICRMTLISRHVQGNSTL